MQSGTEDTYQLACRTNNATNSSTISFLIAETCFATLKIMNSDDHEIRLLLKETLTKGKQEIEFHHGNLLQGDYYIKLIIQTEKIIDLSTLKLNIQ